MRKIDEDDDGVNRYCKLYPRTQHEKVRNTIPRKNTRSPPKFPEHCVIRDCIPQIASMTGPPKNCATDAAAESRPVTNNS